MSPVRGKWVACTGNLYGNKAFVSFPLYLIDYLRTNKTFQQDKILNYNKETKVQIIRDAALQSDRV